MDDELKARNWGRLAAGHLLAAVGDITNALLDDAVGAKFIFEGVQERISKATEQLMRARVLLEANIQAQREAEEQAKRRDTATAPDATG